MDLGYLLVKISPNLIFILPKIRRYIRHKIHYTFSHKSPQYIRYSTDRQQTALRSVHKKEIPVS